MNISNNLSSIYALLNKSVTTPKSFNTSPAKDRFVPCDMPFSQPNWCTIRTKSEPAMSEKEFEDAIIAQARSDAQNGLRRVQSNESASLLQSYMQVASPDRKGIYDYAMEQTGGKMNKSFAFWEGSNAVLRYHPGEKEWMTVGTEAESARKQQFYKIYNEAYFSAKNERAAPSGNDGNVIDLSV